MLELMIVVLVLGSQMNTDKANAWSRISYYKVFYIELHLYFKEHRNPLVIASIYGPGLTSKLLSSSLRKSSTASWRIFLIEVSRAFLLFSDFWKSREARSGNGWSGGMEQKVISGALSSKTAVRCNYFDEDCEEQSFWKVVRLFSMWRKHVSRWTMNRRTKISGFYLYRFYVKPYRRNFKKINKLYWPQIAIFWSSENFPNIDWSEESRFRLWKSLRLVWTSWKNPER